MQLDNNLIDQITQNVLGIFEKVGATRDELHRRVHDAVKEAIVHFDIVTREEFDITSELLSKTRIKVEAMEKKVAELEKLLAEKGVADPSEAAGDAPGKK
ncbi:MAG: accessory factor UbiK family protein [Magnetococcales bacterium]|nr:accessory factor UbiK family protein [Magnetococcales bacterium]MBF0323369.1 accessory factor UbiK family protein [Magnetococcales bacterium]